MPKDLTDVSQWETVAVPVGTDPATASSVETPFQTLTDRTRYLLECLLTMWVLNWLDGDMSAVIGATETGDPIVGDWSGGDGYHYVLATNGGGSPEQWESLDGVTWTPSSSDCPAGYTAPSDAANDGEGERGGVWSGGTDQVGSSNGFANWAAWTVSGTPGLTWRQIEHDRDSLWVIMDGNGVPYSSPGPATAFSAVGTPPSSASGTTPKLVHTHDTDNPMWMAISNAMLATSEDGDTWDGWSAHGLSASPGHLAYSAYGQRWIAPLLDANCTLAISDDNGDTWSETTPVTPLFTPTRAQIASDGFGTWVLVISEAAGPNFQMWVSVDNGETWSRAHLPPDEHGPTAYYHPLWFGQGRFSMVSGTGVSDYAAYSSLRRGE